MIPDQLIKTTVSSNTLKYYKSIGFINIKRGDTIEVSPFQLLPNSFAIEERICDECGNSYTSSHQALEKSYKSFECDICPKCVRTNKYKKKIQSHREKTNLKKYGTTIPSKNSEINNKIIKTNLEKYGTRSTASVTEVREKMKKTLEERYGVDNPMKSEEIKNRVRETCLEKYGTLFPTQNKDIQKKIENTNLEKYGVKSTASIPEIREKMNNTLLDNNNILTSNPQKKVFLLLKELFPESELNLNLVLSNVILDISLIINGIKIDIEYDGKYWHQDRKQKDFARDVFVKSQGYKILRIKSGSQIPKKESLLEIINELIYSDYNFKEIYLSDWSPDE